MKKTMVDGQCFNCGELKKVKYMGIAKNSGLALHYCSRCQRLSKAQERIAKPNEKIVGSILTATVHASIRDFDTSSYKKEHIGDPEQVMVCEVSKKKMVIREMDGAVHELKYVGRGFWQMVGGESVAYKFQQ